MIRTKKQQKNEVQYVLDSEGNQISVIVPMSLWREIQSERETAYLLKSPKMKRRLLKAIRQPEIVPAEKVNRVREQLGI